MKISIVGVGRVGATLAFAIIMKGLADQLVLANRSRQVAEGEAQDLRHASALTPQPVTIQAVGLDEAGLAVTAQSDVVVLCVSVPTDPQNPSRHALLAGNVAIFQEIVPAVAAHSPQAVLLVVTNPVDVMTYHVLQMSGFPATQVIGTGTLIDSARFRALLSAETGIHPDDIRAYILGEHGDTQFPALSVAVTGGERLDRSQAAQLLFDQTVQSGYEIVRRKGYTNYAIALASTYILESIAQDARRTIPVSTLIDGYQGVKDVCLSVPAVIGRTGVIRPLHPKLEDVEVQQFRQSAEVVRKLIEQSMPA